MMWVGVVADRISKLSGVIVKEFVNNRVKVGSDVMGGGGAVAMLRQVVISYM
jgi:hypothetical protein